MVLQEATNIFVCHLGTDEAAKEAADKAKAPSIGSTITIVRNPGKGTVVIKKASPEGESPDDPDSDLVLPSVDDSEKKEAADEKATDASTWHTF